MANPWEHFTAEQLASATGCKVPDVRDTWPRIVEQLEHCGINDRATQIAAAGTIAIESASTFRPVIEAFWLDDAWRRANLSYYPWFGRGVLQLTHEQNYRTYGRKVDDLWKAGGAIDLIARPDDALDPDISAAVLAVYFRDHGGDNMARIPAAARVGNWREVRRLVQGGSAGLDRLEQIAAKLGAVTTNEPGPATVYRFPVQGYSGPVNEHWGVAGAIGGTDLFAPKGTPVVAVHDGTVVYRVENTAVGGNAVQISGTDGLQSYYAHGDRPPAVQMGQAVKAGDVLFGVGDTGNAAGKGHHLHFGMGKDIQTGSGVLSGTGTDFDAVGLLRTLLAQAPPAGFPDQPGDDLAILQNLVGNAFHEDGVVVKALADALANPDDKNLRVQADAVLRWLRENNPHKAA